MSSERDQWLKSIGMSYALLRVALGLNICLHGFIRWTVGLLLEYNSRIPWSIPFCWRGLDLIPTA